MLVLSHRCVAGGGRRRKREGGWTGEDFGRHSVWPHRRSGPPQMSWQVWSGFVGQAVIECSTNGASLSSRSGGNCPRSRWPRPCRPPSLPSRTLCCHGPQAPLEGKKIKIKITEEQMKLRLFFNKVQKQDGGFRGCGEHIMWSNYDVHVHWKYTVLVILADRVETMRDWGCDIAKVSSLKYCNTISNYTFITYI